MHSPRLRGAGRCSLGALHAACAAARVIHHPGITRCGCSISTDVRIKSAAPPRCELCANAVKLQWLASTLPGLLRAGHVDRSADARQLDFDAALLPARRIRRSNGCGSLLLSPSTAIEQPARRTPRSIARLRRGRVKPPSRRVTSYPAATPRALARLRRPQRSLRPFGSGRCPARLAQRARPGFRAAKLSINAEIPASGTTTR